MKKYIAFFLILACALSVLGCGAARPDTTTAATTAPTTQPLPPVEGIRNIVLIIGDGMGPNQIKGGMLCAGREYNFTKWPGVRVNTNSLDTNGEATVTTDSAASATALATGVLTYNSYVGKDPEKKDLKTILDYAAETGRATGVLTTDKLTGATPSGFSGHSPDRSDSDTILNTQLLSDITLLAASQSATVYNYRSMMEANGYSLFDMPNKIKNNMDAEKMLWQLNLSGHNSQHKLYEVAIDALNYLDQDREGFVLMIEQANIDTFCHSNDFAGAERCVQILDKTVDAVVEWIGDRKDTIVLVTADHETGGLSVSAEPEYAMSYESDNGTVYYQYTQTTHSPTPVWLYTYGAQIDFTPYLLTGEEYAQYETGIIKNTSVFRIMHSILENPTDYN